MPPQCRTSADAEPWPEEARHDDDDDDDDEDDDDAGVG